MARVAELVRPEDFQSALDASQEGPVALLKHSIACPISARGQEQFVGLEAEGDPPLYCVVVQYARPLSQHIAETLGVKHETPQALILRRGKAVAVFNHREITTAGLREAARAAAREAA
ncbi:MAG: bacillithiol system redox-active protein YtxJ [Rubricoccaceae bacterium]